MSAPTDATSKIPVRTINQTDVQVQIADPSTPTQQAAVDSHGSLQAKIADASGNVIESFDNGGKYSLGVGIDVAGSQVDPRQIRALTSADVVTVDQGTANTEANAWPMKVTDGTNGPAAVKAPSTAAAAADPSLVVALSPNSPIPAGTNVIGKVELEDGSGNAISSTAINSKQRLDVDLSSEGQSGSAAPYSTVQVGGTDGTDLRALKTDANGILAQNVYSGGNPNSSSNPLFVTVTNTTPGTPVNYYNATASIAASGSDNTSSYTITASKTLSVKKVWASSSQHMRCDFQTSPDGTTWTTIASLYIPWGGGNASFDYDEISVQDSGSGAAVRVVCYNEDTTAASATVSICGTEN